MHTVKLCISWWYGSGLAWAWRYALVERLRRCAEEFSIKTVLTTLFSPYKQTFAGGTAGSFQNRFRGLIDRFISRIVGFMVRIVILLTGLVCSLFIIVTGLLMIILWPVLPVFVLVNIVMQIAGKA